MIILRNCCFMNISSTIHCCWEDNSVTIQKCYDGDAFTTTEGEKIRLSCINTSELRSKKADPIPAQAARNHLNDLIAGSTVTIRPITKDRYGRTVSELSKGSMNIQEHLVEKDFASIYERYSSQCEWSKNKVWNSEILRLQ